MNSKDFRKMGPEELDQIILDLRKELFALRFQLATGQLQKTHLIRQTRRLVAKAITIRRQQEIEGKRKA